MTLTVLASLGAAASLVLSPVASTAPTVSGPAAGCGWQAAAGRLAQQVSGGSDTAAGRVRAAIAAAGLDLLGCGEGPGSGDTGSGGPGRDDGAAAGPSHHGDGDGDADDGDGDADGDDGGGNGSGGHHGDGGDGDETGGGSTGDGGSSTGDGGSSTGDGGSSTGDGGSSTGDGGSSTGDGGSSTGGTDTGGTGSTSGTGTVPRPDHIVVVVEENENASSVIGNTSAGYLNSLAARGANLTDAHAETHPSQPNYLALFSGSTQGVSDDSCLSPLASPSLGSQLLGAGLSFTGYSEDLPGVGDRTCTAGDYARKHVPWAVFGNLPGTTNQPFTAFPSDFSQLPTVSFVIPNLCHDMHDCSVATGDRWLQQHISAYETWARTHNSLLVVTWDEAADSSPDNHIATVVSGANVRAGDYAEAVDHYRLLRTIEDAYGLAPLGAAANATPITDIWAPVAAGTPTTAQQPPQSGPVAPAPAAPTVVGPG